MTFGLFFSRFGACTFGVTAAFFALSAAPARAQQLGPLQVQPISLPKEIAYYDNQFSGLFISQNKLFLLSESRLQDKAEGKLYGISLPDLERKLTDTTYVLPYRKYHLYNLEQLRDRITARQQVYEGLEAMTITGNTVYFSVETATPSPDCFVLKGTLGDTAVVLDPEFLLPVPKPTFADGSRVYNAGFEALAIEDNQLFGVFEYNYFGGGNYVYQLPVSAPPGQLATRLPLDKLPYRITDLTATGRRRYTAINYFFKGEGEDSVYRTPADDQVATPLIKSGATYQNYCRLITLRRRGKHFSWQPLGELPRPYMSYNWEGIAAYKKGYFLMNDKYTPARPYASVLLYVRPAHR